MTKLLHLTWLATASACAIDLDPSTGEIEQDIWGPWTAPSQFQIDREAHLFYDTANTDLGLGCSAVRIGPRHLLSASHCLTKTGAAVQFYSTGTGIDPGLTATVANVFTPPGVMPSVCLNSSDATGCYDASGLFADIEVLELTNVAIPGGVDSLARDQAVLAWRYPGLGITGQAVGSGWHDGVKNPDFHLRQVTDVTDDSVDTDGHFQPLHDWTNSGDSGGPFYVNGRVIGILYGEGSSGEDRYTSVARHLDWILQKIGYHWPGTPSQAGIAYNGTMIESFVATERGCQYACDHTASCEAYNYLPSGQSCGLYKAVTNPFTSAITRSALHYGQSGGKSNQVVGYLRGDGWDSVLHVAPSDGHIHELFSAGGSAWSAGDISNHNPPAVASKLSAYRRADGINAVVYRSTTNRIIEIANTTEWNWADLTNWGGATPVGNPVAYVRADGSSAVVFRSANGHINELRLAANGWIPEDLTFESAVGVTATSDPSVYVRSDGYSSVVFQSGSQIFELFKQTGRSWDWGEPSAVTVDGAPPAANGRPYGYTHRDGTNAIVYRSTANKIIELFISPTGWKHGDITERGPAAAGDPVAYVRTDGVESVVYRSGTQVQELTNIPWKAWNLTSQWGADASFTDPAVYIRRDGHNSVVSGLAAGHVGEIAYRIGEPWVPDDLTIRAGETP